MSIDKPSLTVRPELTTKDKVNLLKLDPSLIVKEHIAVLTKLEVRGGRGNQILNGWNKGSTDEKQSHKEPVMYDYKPGTPQPKEWANIEVGRDTFKLTPNEKATIRNGLLSVIAFVCFLVTWLVFY